MTRKFPTLSALENEENLRLLSVPWSRKVERFALIFFFFPRFPSSELRRFLSIIADRCHRRHVRKSLAPSIVIKGWLRRTRSSFVLIGRIRSLSKQTVHHQTASDRYHDYNASEDVVHIKPSISIFLLALSNSYRIETFRSIKFSWNINTFGGIELIGLIIRPWTLTNSFVDRRNLLAFDFIIN